MIDRKQGRGDGGGAGEVGVDVELPRVCRLLRTKTAWGRDERGQTWKLGDSTTAVYWCLATMEAFGVDDDFCHPHKCVQGRSCWQRDEGDEE